MLTALALFLLSKTDCGFFTKTWILGTAMFQDVFVILYLLTAGG